MTETVLVTGTAGFIGNAVALSLLQNGKRVVGVDNLNDYYDPQLKTDRLDRLKNFSSYANHQMDVEDKDQLNSIFLEEKPDQVIHLAAQAGVRYSMEEPWSYLTSNISGFLSVLEACRSHPVKHLLFASTSTVYGLNETVPFHEDHTTDHQVSLYGATKKSNEMMAHVYSHLYDIPVTGLRFFTVYGPWGRPDMALFKFTKKILKGEPIDIYNHGDMMRDFTYIDDISDAIIQLRAKPAMTATHDDAANPLPSKSTDACYRIFNIGNSAPISLLDYIDALEEALGKKAIRNYLPAQPGELPKTFANVEALKNEIGYAPKTSVREGVQNFVDWYRSHYQ